MRLPVWPPLDDQQLSQQLLWLSEPWWCEARCMDPGLEIQRLCCGTLTVPQHPEVKGDSGRVCFIHTGTGLEEHRARRFACFHPAATWQVLVLLFCHLNNLQTHWLRAPSFCLHVTCPKIPLGHSVELAKTQAKRETARQLFPTCIVWLTCFSIFRSKHFISMVHLRTTMQP